VRITTSHRPNQQEQKPLGAVFVWLEIVPSLSHYLTNIISPSLHDRLQMVISIYNISMDVKNYDRANVQRVILGILEISAMLTVTAIAPNALQLFKYIGPKKGRYQRTYYINQATDKLYQRRLIEYKINKQGIRCARLTSKGLVELNRYRFAELTIPKSKHWDKKYRLVIFDIKEWKRGTRDRVRRWLEHLGFVKLQNSVWVHPYECQEIVVLLKSHFKIGMEILYLTVESIENDLWLKRKFGLE